MRATTVAPTTAGSNEIFYKLRTNKPLTLWNFYFQPLTLNQYPKKRTSRRKSGNSNLLIQTGGGELFGGTQVALEHFLLEQNQPLKLIQAILHKSSLEFDKRVNFVTEDAHHLRNRWNLW